MKLLKHLLILLALMFIANNTVNAQLWQQIGADIDGEASSDGCGVSVTMNGAGDMLAVGALYNDGNGSNSGQVRVFEQVAGQWSQLGANLDGESAEDVFGISVSMNGSGNIVAVGAPQNSGNGFQSGHVKVFEWTGTSWVQVGNNIEGEAAGDLSGFSVSLNHAGDVLAIGAPYNNGSDTASGHTRVYALNQNNWMQLGIDIDGDSAFDFGGGSVSLDSSGTRLAIGAKEHDARGQAKMYEWNGASWQQMGQDIDGVGHGDKFGQSLVLNHIGNIVAIGAPRNDYAGSNAGQMRVFEWNGSSWVLRGNAINAEDANDRAAYSVSMNAKGDVVSYGVPRDSNANNRAGCVRTFRWVSGIWHPWGAKVLGEFHDDQFGYSIALNDKGDVFTGGAPFNSENDYLAGHARVFENCATISIDHVTACDSFTWINSVIYTESNATAKDTFIGSNGCDSIVFLNLTILNGSTSTEQITSCGPLTWIDGVNYASDTTAAFVVSNSSGCDSIIYLSLVIPQVNDTIILSGDSLVAKEASAAYQWVSCEEELNMVPGATARSYVPVLSGTYAVLLSKDGCVDTSNCIEFNVVGTSDMRSHSAPLVYPVPFSDRLHIKASAEYQVSGIKLWNTQGVLVRNWQARSVSERETVLEVYVDPGAYIVELTMIDGARVLRSVIKQ